MKNRNRILGFATLSCLTICISLFLAPVASATTTGTSLAWTTDIAPSGEPDANFSLQFGATFTSDFYLTNLSGGQALFIFKNGDTFPLNNTVTFSHDGTNWTATNTYGNLTLGSYLYFGFKFDSLPTYNYYGSGDMWYFDDGSGTAGVTVSAADVRPVPIPAAALLLGSGLVGLFTIRKKTLKG